MEKAFVYTDKMTVGYHKKPLIRDIDIRLERGQIMTLIGPNGAGKSTILKSMIGQLSLVGGVVFLEQNSIQKMNEKEIAKKISVVMTERLHPELMTCEDVVSTGRYPHTGRLGILSEKDREKVFEAMELVHALDLRHCDFQKISDGQRQRILLARAICQEPEMIVLDEPTSFLDIRHKLELLTILKQMVQKKQVSVIMSLHELDLAQKISDMVVCVHGDTIARFGPPEKIFTSEYISELYEVTNGSYNADFGCVELEPVRGEPQIFVIGGGGSAIPVYRKLQRNGIPFATGVLHKNDVDYAVAKELAVQTVLEEAFEPIGEEAFAQAAYLVEKCEKVFCPLQQFGKMNERNRELAGLAKKWGKLFAEK